MTQVIDASKQETEVIDRLSSESDAGSLALQSPPPSTVNMGLLQQMGFVTPIATPEQLRAAFDYQQRMFASILSESDYLYTVSWTSDNKNQQRVLTDFAEAQSLAEKFKNLGAQLAAKPKKSGIVKLARALGITAERRVVKGLPDEPLAQYSYVEYVASHERSGMDEVGVGWCDKSERGGRISTHDVIATADTRAYNRAVLRLAGFGDVSADEIIAGVGDDGDVPEAVPETPKQKTLQPVPELTSDDVLAASRAWAEAFLDAKEAPASKQDTRSARETRAKARRGVASAAKQLGTLGLHWSGTCSDGMGYPTFDAGTSPVSPKDIAEARAAAQEAPPPTASATTAPPQDPPKGWDLSGAGSVKDDAPPPAVQEAESGIPGPSPTAETITTGQAKKVSSLLKSIFSTTDEMKAWLKTNCHVDSSIQIRSNQYEPIMAALKKREGKE